MGDAREAICAIVGARCGHEPPLDAHLIRDLYLGAGAIIDIVEEVEGRLSIEMSDDDIEGIATVADLVKVAGRLASRGAA